MIEYERYILEALQKAVIALGLTIPVKYVGRTITPPSAGKWLEVVYIPNNGTGDFWSEGKLYKGTLRLILHWPMDNAGAYSAIDLTKAIAAGFIKGSKFQDAGNNVTVDIVDHPDVSDIIEQAPELLIPLTIRYSCLKV